MRSSRLFKFFSSLKLAVFSILSLASVLAVATILESKYGMRASHVMVYGTWWFAGVLFFLATNVFCAALSRYPWKRRQTGFVITHLGILILLAGSVLTQQLGVDGNMPIEEGKGETAVFLNDLALTVSEEDRAKAREYVLPESGLAKEGRLFEVKLSPTTSLVVEKFLPRSTAQTQVVPSPVAGLGVPAIEVEVANERFQVNEWLVSRQAHAPTELNLGPASLTFQKLWTPEEEKAFFAPPRIAKKVAPTSTLLVHFEGREFRVLLTPLPRGWRPVGSSGLQVRIDRYLPHAIVEANELVSKSNEPVNPALQLHLRGQGREERHTVFANFADFATLHGAHSKGAEGSLGVKLRMVVASSPENLQGVGTQRGRLLFAQSADDKRLLYRVLSRDGAVNSQGEVKPGIPTETGWMDLKFRVDTWHPFAVEQEAPVYVESVQGTDGNFSAALLLRVEDRAAPAGSVQPPPVWLSEGQGRLLPVGDRQLIVQLNKKKLTLPFPLHLEKFHVGHDPGTSKAATYESQVRVTDPIRGTIASSTISMNEPLVHGGYTFYQASYQLQEGRPPVSVFAVNYDPGRVIKYTGSLVMVLGILLMFCLNPHYWDKLFGKKEALS